jgi:hypothetical protein
MNAHLKSKIDLLTKLYRKGSVKPNAIALEPDEFDALCDLVSQQEALQAVAHAAEELRQEQTSLDAADERPTERERVEARHFYRRTVHEAQVKLDEALENLTAINKQK